MNRTIDQLEEGHFRHDRHEQRKNIKLESYTLADGTNVEMVAISKLA